MSHDVTNSEVSQADNENVAAATPGKPAKTSSDGRSNRKKKVAFPVPENKLSFPFQDGVPEWSLSYSKLAETDFQTSKQFKQWEFQVYYPARIARLEEIHAEKVKPHQDAIDKLRVELEDAEKVTTALGIEDENQQAAVADILGDVAKALAGGLNAEQIAQAVMLLQQSKSESKSE